MLRKPTPIHTLVISILFGTTIGTQCVKEYSKFFEHHPHVFIDKSLTLATFFNTTLEPYNFITCPKNFGKTSVLNMIKTFAQIEMDDTAKPRPWKETRAYGIFSELRISSYPEVISRHMARYPVIFLNLHFESIEFKLDKRYTTRIMTQLKHSFKRYERICEKIVDNIPSESANITKEDIMYLKKGIDGNLTKDELQNSLYRLSEILYYYFNHTKVMLLIDRYDSAAVLAMTTSGRYAHNHYEFVHEMLSRALEKGSRYIEYALIMATTSLSYYSVDHSKLIGILQHRPFLDDHPFSSFCGILENESVDLFDKHYCDQTERLEIKKYYNGYTTIQGNTIYDPYSMTRYFDNKFRQTRNYWQNSVGAELMYNFLHFNDVHETLSLALLGDHSFESDFVISKKYNNDALYVFMQLKDCNYTRVYLDKTKCVGQMLTFLFEQGYLSHIPGASHGYRSANQQTRLEILDIFKNFTESPGEVIV